MTGNFLHYSNIVQLSATFTSKLVDQMEIRLKIDGQPFEKIKTMNLPLLQNILRLAISIVTSLYSDNMSELCVCLLAATCAGSNSNKKSL